MPTTTTTTTPQALLTTPPNHLDVGHSQLAHRVVGSGPDLVFVHGWPLSSATWRGVVPILAQHFTCHLIDLPGAGQTITTPDAPIGLRAHATTVVRAIEQLGLRQLSFVAHDSGGGIARYAAAQLGDRVQSLVLSGTEIPGHHSLLLRMLIAGGALPTRAWQRLLDLRWLVRSRLMLGSCFADPRHAEGDFDRLMLEPLRRSPRAMEGQLRLLRTLDLREIDGLEGVHAQLRAPTLLVWGSDDRFFPITKARAMMRQFGGPVDLVEIERGRTFVHDEMPERFAAAALDHLRAGTCSRGATMTVAQTGS